MAKDKNSEHVLIPTKDKDKLPKGFSFPLGAQKISEALGQLPQNDNIFFRFWCRDEFWKSKWQKRINEKGTVTLIEAKYSSLFNEWWLFVYAVPSEYNKSARDYLLNGQLQTVSTLLRKASKEPMYFHHTIEFNLAEHTAS